MYDQSFSKASLRGCIKKSDIRSRKSLRKDDQIDSLVESGVNSAYSNFCGINPLEAFHHRRRTLYRFKNLHDELVVRKIHKNLKFALRKSNSDRNFIVSNIIRLTQEGVPYRVYRLDIKSFYESIDIEHLCEQIKSARIVSQSTKENASNLLSHYKSIGGTGIPRGLGISSILSELYLHDFDNKIKNHPAVYYYSRYVDDIIIISSAKEKEKEFIETAKGFLPKGLVFSEKRGKNEILTISESLSKKSRAADLLKCEFNYLGYNFKIYDPAGSGKGENSYRKVVISISENKESKIKSRIIRSIISFTKNGDYKLLLDRIKLLTSNFSIYDYDSGRYKLSGIYQNYPKLSEGSSSLENLDKFLSNSILSKKGRLFSISGAMLTNSQRREILKHTFQNGFEKRIFTHFSHKRIAEIQECWTNE